MDRRAVLIHLVAVMICGCTASRKAQPDQVVHYSTEQDRERETIELAEREAEKERRVELRKAERERDRHDGLTKRTSNKVRRDGRSETEIQRYEEERLRDQVRRSVLTPPQNPLQPVVEAEPLPEIPLPVR
jgi:hypothetical protein